MTNTERVLDLVRRRPGLSDREIRERTGIEPHQQVNQITNRLAQQGRIVRVREDGALRNYPAGAEPPQDPSPTRTAPTPAPRGAGTPRGASVEDGDWAVPPLTEGRPLVVLPCSARKRRGGTHAAAGPSVLDMIPSDLAEELRAARARAGAVPASSGKRLAAWQRYDGHLYQAAGRVWPRLRDAGVPALILSGGYGVVDSHEPIAWYDTRFQPARWPGRVVERCLTAIAEHLQVDRVVAFAGASTPYATWPAGRAGRCRRSCSPSTRRQGRCAEHPPSWARPSTTSWTARWTTGGAPPRG